MFLSKDIGSFSGLLTQLQANTITSFFNETTDWGAVKHGEKRTLQENISAVFINAKGTDEYRNILEAHRKFYDLHFTAEGSDMIVSKPVAACSNIRTAYNDDGDYILFDEEPEGSLAVPAGSFCLIPPSEAHMALYGSCGAVKKIVFKIPVQ